MRVELIEDLLRHLDTDGSLQVEQCAESASQQLEEMPLPLDVKRLLQWSWVNRIGKVGPYTVVSVEESLLNEDQPRLLPAMMYCIGYALNGDLLVLRFEKEGSCSVGLVGHEEFWGLEGPVLEKAYAEVTPSVDEYLWRAAEGRYLPTDFYAASELATLRREMNDQ